VIDLKDLANQNDISSSISAGMWEADDILLFSKVINSAELPVSIKPS
jgi:hypothetical protein